MLSQSRFFTKTKPELKVQKFLDEHNIDYIESYILDSTYEYDFKIGNTLIEVHGDYWHANPLYYGLGKKSLNEIQMKKIEKDKIKFLFATDRGFKVLYIWETYINSQNYESIMEVAVR